MIDKVIRALDEYVGEHGYGRLGGAVVSFLGVASVLSALFGTTWFRLVSVSAVAVAAVLVLLLGIAERNRLYARIERDADVINRYARVIHHRNPYHVKKWVQWVTIEANGDCVIRIQQTISPASDVEPHFLLLSCVYYGSAPLTDRMKRRVKHDAYFRNGGGSSRGVRAYSTYSWGSPSGRAAHFVTVHLSGKVEDGDVVTVEWRWPRYSADLRACRAAELFDLKLTNEVIDVRYEIRLKDVDGVQPAIARRGVRSVSQKWENDDYVIVFSAKRPVPGERFGVELDMKPRSRRQAG